MSLTRAQWEEMWISAKQIEAIADFLRKQRLQNRRMTTILRETTKIKEQIQSVIGQME